MGEGVTGRGRPDGGEVGRGGLLREMRPHGRVALVTAVVAISAVVVLVLSLPGFGRTGRAVAEAREVYGPPLEQLRRVDDGLSEVQYLFDATITEPDTVQRVLNLEEVRRQLSRNEEAWRRFREDAVGLPGEDELVATYESAMARQAELSGPVGYGLILAEDPSGMVGEDVVVELLGAQREAGQAVRGLADLYRPALDDALDDAARSSADGRRLLLVSFGALSAVCLVVAGGAYRSARRTDRVQRAEHERREVQARRDAFENRLTRALDMAASEPFAYDVIGQATAEVLPEGRAELLLAEGASSPFHRVLTTDGPGRGPGCRVPDPSSCPAAHRGDRLVFPSSSALDACPYLRERPGERAAVCQPLSIGGRSLGVVHVTFDGDPPGDEPLVALDLLGRRAGDRLSMLRAFAESESQARIDPLTGLRNRRSLDEEVRALDGGPSYCVAYVDLDHFKRLNDTHGHEVGDRALHLFARVLVDGVRPEDLVCRYGGEEFLVVLPDCDLAAARTVVERIRTMMASALSEAGLPPFTASVGVAASSQGAGFSAVVALADAALLRAKATGRDRVVVAGDGGPAALPVAGST